MNELQKQTSATSKYIPRTRLHLPFPRHDRTAFVRFDMKRCIACGDCIMACPSKVLGIISFLNHRHVHVDHAADCKGCRKCLAACQRGVIRPIQVKAHRSITRSTDTKRKSSR